MQFGGIRTDLNFKPLGQPINWLIKLPEDVLPEPEAVMVHGISPQQTLAEGITEREFANRLNQEIFLPDTIAVGFNNIRFDDEFIRYIMWRNFHDPYEWHYLSGRGRFDLLDLTRMTRALRPDGLVWPDEGNRLVYLAEANGIDIGRAHDAQADIEATLEWARRLKSAQPKLFDFAFGHWRDKSAVAKLIHSEHPLSRMFVYTSGAYPSDFAHTTVAVVLGPHPSDSNSVLVYDLRYNPKAWGDLSAKQLSSLIYLTREQRAELTPLPVKKLSLNRCPAVAPMTTLDAAAQKRIELTPAAAAVNLERLQNYNGFYQRVAEAYDLRASLPKRLDADSQLYDGFLNSKDQNLLKQVRSAEPDKLADLSPEFIDERLPQLLLRYKARNLPFTLSQSEQTAWESWRSQKLVKGVDGSLTLKEFAKRLNRTAEHLTAPDQRFLLEELKLYAESIAPPQLFDL